LILYLFLDLFVIFCIIRREGLKNVDKSSQNGIGVFRRWRIIWRIWAWSRSPFCPYARLSSPASNLPWSSKNGQDINPPVIKIFQLLIFLLKPIN